MSRVLEAATPRDLVRGLEAVERLVREHGIRGVHGTLLDLFDIDAHPGHATAVEVTAGNNLFYVVVRGVLFFVRWGEVFEVGGGGSFWSR